MKYIAIAITTAMLLATTQAHAFEIPTKEQLVNRNWCDNELHRMHREGVDKLTIETNPKVKDRWDAFKQKCHHFYDYNPHNIITPDDNTIAGYFLQLQHKRG